MDIFTVSFFGHRYLNDHRTVENKLQKLIRRLIDEKQYVDFLVGRNGDFDQLAASTVRRVKKSTRADNSSLVLVLPYLTADYLNNKEAYEDYYDEVEVCGESAVTHYKNAIRLRNRHMADRADLIVSCIEHKSGGAYNAVKYALKNYKTVINITDI